MRCFRAIGLALSGLLLLTSSLHADEKVPDMAQMPEVVQAPDQIVSEATTQLLKVIEGARSYYDADPERYFSQIGTILDPMVDFDGMARLVMGKWGTSAYYNGMSSDAERQALKENADRFANAFRSSLIETYGKGVLAFSGERIEVLPISPADVASGRVYVIQKIHGKSAQPLVIKYFMVRRSPDEGWRLLNVLIGDVNIGMLYRSQFASAMQRYQDDMQQVIESWMINESDVKS